MSKFFKEDNGFSLIAVTWIVLLMSLLATGVLSLALTSRQTIASLETVEKQRLLFESTIDIFMHRYFYADENPVFRAGELALYDETIVINVQYESGKININYADIPLLSALFAAAGQEAEKALDLAAAIVDWRDSDDVLTEGGAERPEYEDQGIPHKPRNGAFESVGELQNILGMDTQLFLCVRPLLTVYSLSDSANPDPRYITNAVRQVLQWAYDKNWAGEVWQDIDAFVPGDSVIVADDELVGESLRLFIRLKNNNSVLYSTIVRFGSTAQNNVHYNRLLPLQREVNLLSDIGCPFVLD